MYACARGIGADFLAAAALHKCKLVGVRYASSALHARNLYMETFDFEPILHVVSVIRDCVHSRECTRIIQCVPVCMSLCVCA
jgi:hypothetical protein